MENDLIGALEGYAEQKDGLLALHKLCKHVASPAFKITTSPRPPQHLILKILDGSTCLKELAARLLSKTRVQGQDGFDPLEARYYWERLPVAATTKKRPKVREPAALVPAPKKPRPSDKTTAEAARLRREQARLHAEEAALQESLESNEKEKEQLCVTYTRLMEAYQRAEDKYRQVPDDMEHESEKDAAKKARRASYDKAVAAQEKHDSYQRDVVTVQQDRLEQVRAEIAKNEESLEEAKSGFPPKLGASNRADPKRVIVNPSLHSQPEYEDDYAGARDGDDGDDDEVPAPGPRGRGQKGEK